MVTQDITCKKKKSIKDFFLIVAKKKNLPELNLNSLRTSHLGISVLHLIKIQDSVYLPLYLIYLLFILFSISMYGEVTSGNHQAYS